MFCDSSPRWRLTHRKLSSRQMADLLEHKCIYICKRETGEKELEEIKIFSVNLVDCLNG